MLTRDEAEAELAIGALTLREIAQRWHIPMEEAYRRLYDRPMPPPAAPPATGRRLIRFWQRPRKVLL
jgi:hypothetical protein